MRAYHPYRPDYRRQGTPFTTASVDLKSMGYVEEEYFLDGDATAHDWQTSPGTDGPWAIKTTTTAHYKTRFLVRRPTDPARSNGSVFVEWLNVSGGIDDDPDFGYAHVELLRSGWTYVGVSAQAEGVIGGGFSLGTSMPLVTWDPARYGTLEASGRRLFVRHVLAGRVRRSPHRRYRRCREAARYPHTSAVHCGGRVAVRRLYGDLRKCDPARGQGLRRHLHPQPLWRRCRPCAGFHRILSLLGTGRRPFTFAMT